MSRRLYFAGLALVIALAAWLRMPLLHWAADSYRLTEAFSIEEVENVRISTGMLHESSANPHAFEYPSLFYYLSLAVEAPVHAAFGPDWTRYLVAVRSLSLGFGLIAIVLAATLARRLGGEAAGLFAAAVLATDGTMIQISALAKPNAAQVAFLLAGFLALVALATAPRLRHALVAAAFFGLATAAKWLGLLGMTGLVVAPALGVDPGSGRGLRGLAQALRHALRARLTPVQIGGPLLVFGTVAFLSMPYALLSPREFGYGLAQVFFAQAGNRRPLPPWVSFEYLIGSAGPVVTLLLAGGVLWAIARTWRWDRTPAANGIVLVLGWVIAYGWLVLFVFARLPSYLDLWIPFLAVLAGLAWAGRESFVRPPALRLGMVGMALVAGLWTNGASSRARAQGIESDTRTAAGRWLAGHATSGSTVLADLGVFVPDSLNRVRWNWWGSPPRLIYDETATWGDDPIWPDDWYGGHRQLLFQNARWASADSLLARHPDFVLTTEEWIRRRSTPGRSTAISPTYDRSLRDGSAGYSEVGRFAPGEDGMASGPEIVVYARSNAPSESDRP